MRYPPPPIATWLFFQFCWQNTSIQIKPFTWFTWYLKVTFEIQIKSLLCLHLAKLAAKPVFVWAGLRSNFVWIWSLILLMQYSAFAIYEIWLSICHHLSLGTSIGFGKKKFQKNFEFLKRAKIRGNESTTSLLHSLPP